MAFAQLSFRHRNKSSIYRIINRRKAKVLLAKKFDFVTSDKFLEHDVKKQILVEPSALRNTESIKLTGSSLSEYRP